MLSDLSEIWQDNYLSIFATAKVATQLPKALDPQKTAWHVWNPAIQCCV